MLKLALAIAALTGAATTAYIVRTPAAPAPSASTVSSTAPSAEAAATAVTAGKPTTPRRATAAAPALPEKPRVVHQPDEAPVVDRATIERLALYKGPSRGPVDAPVTIVVFTDLRCTHCGNALGTVDQLWDDYPGKLRLVVKQLPVHESAVLPAEAALAAEAQGKFWELHDLMMANQDDLSRDRLNALAERAGLDVAAFKTALDKHRFAPALEADKAAATSLDIQATPAFLINGHRVIGNHPPETFKDVIDQVLAEP
jgi:protein-disulfide isomerase